MHKVALIDDDRMSTHNWRILLKFIREDVVVLKSDRWKEGLGDRGISAGIYAIMIGEVMAGDAMGDGKRNVLIDEIHQLLPGIPVLLTNTSDDLTSLPSASRPHILKMSGGSAQYEDLLNLLRQARARQGLAPRDDSSKLISETGTAMFRSLSGSSTMMQDVRALIRQVADRNINVLIQGESGTGKEIVARNLHYHSGRGEKPFITVNCAAIIPEQFDEMLYGREDGASAQVKPGLFEKANEGTLFLDKISDLPLTFQAKLLQLLEDQRFERLGGTKSIRTDARIIAATHEDLQEKMRRAEFREDLYYQLSVMPIHLPALREHVEDIPDLVAELLARLENQRQSVRFNSAAILSLQRHPWPGNVRELANLVERLSIVYPDAVVGVGDLPVDYQHVSPAEESQLKYDGPKEVKPEIPAVNAEPLVSQSTGDQKLPAMNPENLRRYLINFERNMIEVALEDSSGSVKFAAARLSMKEVVLKEKMREFGLD